MPNFVFADSVYVTIFIHNEPLLISCSKEDTIADIRLRLHQMSDMSESMAFFSSNDLYLPDNQTIGQVLQDVGGRRILEVYTRPKASFKLQIYGFENSIIDFNAAPQLTPAELREEMTSALGLNYSDFCIFIDSEELDMSKPFSELPEGTTLILDPRTQVRITSRGADGEETATTIECRASSTIGDLSLIHI